MKISAGFVVTEPIRLGYLSYLECAQSLLDFCDEVVVIVGREEQESTSKMRALGVKLVVTDAWPVEYSYDVMRDHFQLIFDNSSGDICFKVDSDHVFKKEQSSKIRDVILALDKFHRINFGGIKFVKIPNFFNESKNKGIYGINRTLLKEDGINFQISNETGSNQPKFSNHIKEYSINDLSIKPINYDCAFMTQKQVIYKWKSWMKAFLWQSSDKVHNVDQTTDAKLLEGFMDYHRKKNAGAHQAPTLSHPQIMIKKVANITPEMWGHNNWQ